MKDTCIICGGANLISGKAQFYPFLIERMFENQDKTTDILHCLDCDVYYSSYRPSSEELSRLYTGYRDDFYQEQRQRYESGYTQEFNRSLGFSNENRVIRNKIMLDMTRKYFDCQDVKMILDYGGDSGQYIPLEYIHAEKFVYDISGADPVEGVKSIEKGQLYNHKWDLIMCCHVLEHDSSPINIIDEIKSLMRVGSYLYIELPYEDYVNNIDSGILIHEHINFFRTKTLDTVFSGLDFVILENRLVNVADVSGRVFGQHICCLVKKVASSDTTLMLKQIARMKNEVVDIIENQSDILTQKVDQLKEQNTQLKEQNTQLTARNAQLTESRNELMRDNIESQNEILTFKNVLAQQKKYKRRYRLAMAGILLALAALFFMKAQ